MIKSDKLEQTILTGGPPDTTTDMHFGGFLTKNEGGTNKHLSSKDVMDEIVAKSKMQKVRWNAVKMTVNYIYWSYYWF